MEITREVIGELKLLAESNKKLQKVEIWALNDLVNRNGWQYIRLKEHLSEFLNIPILTAYENGGRRIGGGHNMDERINPETGEPYMSFTAPDAERIVGWINQDSNVRIEEKDGVSWIVCEAFLWTWYSSELVRKILRQGQMSVSIETLILEEHMEGDVAVEDKYIVLGVTVLGDGVAPAVADASIKSLAMLSECRSCMQKEILKAASYIGDGKAEPKEPKKINQKGVTQAMTPKRVLEELSAKFNGFMPVGATEDRKVIALLSDKNVPYGYAFEDSDDGNVIANRICEATAEVSFKFNESEVIVPLEAIISDISEKLNASEAQVKSLSENNETLVSQLGELRNKENARRLKAAKDAMTDELKQLNANRDENKQFSVEICKELSARIDNGEFTAVEDKDGNWIGEKLIRNEVKALCMDEQAKMDKDENERFKKYNSWNMPKNNSAEPTTVGDMLSE